MMYVYQLDSDSLQLISAADKELSFNDLDNLLNSKIDDIQDFLTDNHLKYDKINHVIIVNTFTKEQSKAYNQVCRLLKNRSLSLTQRQLTTDLKHDLQRSIKKHKQFRQ